MNSFDEINKALESEEEEEVYAPRARFPEKYKLSKANSRRAELQERILTFLNYKNPKVFGIRTAHLSVDDLEYMLSASKQFKPNPQACFWKILKESTPK